MITIAEAQLPYDADLASVRRCSRCGAINPVDAFPIQNKKTGRRRVWCRDCCRAYGREHYRRTPGPYLERAQARRRLERPRMIAAIAAHLRTHPCVDCGETDILLLDFDHRDRSTKRAPVSRLAHGATLAAVLSEIEKCDVRCGNCHRRKTSAELNWRRTPGFQSRRQVLPAPKRAPRASSTGLPAVDQLGIWTIGTTKRCSRCHLDRPLHEFAFSDRKEGARQGYCRPCHAAYRREHYARNRADYIAWAERQGNVKYETQTALIDQYLREHPCVDCGQKNIVLLEFDHIDEADKTLDLSATLGRRSWRVILTEIGKCDVRCVNCHRRRTAERFNWAKRFGEDPILYNAA